MTDSGLPFDLSPRDQQPTADQLAPESLTIPRRHRRRPRRPYGCYSVRDPAEFCLRSFATPENLNLAFQQLIDEGGPAPGTDGFGPECFSSHERWPILRQISSALNTGAYSRYPSREVVIPRSENRVRILRLMRFTDRCVAKALLNCLSNFWCRRSISMSIRQIYAHLNREIRRRRVYYLAIDDIRDCFPNAPLDEVISCQRLSIPSEPLMQLITRVIRCQDDAGQIGLEQGSPYSPIAMDALLHHHLDRVMTTRESRTGILYRFVDNLTFLCRDASEGRRLNELAQELLSPLRFNLKGQAGEWGDLRDPNFQTTLLGLIPRWQNGQLTFEIPESAFSKLETYLQTSSEFSCPWYRAQRCCLSWIWSYGPALTRPVALQVSSRINRLAAQYGFRSLTRTVLITESNRAYQNWLRFLREFG